MVMVLFYRQGIMGTKEFSIEGIRKFLKTRFGRKKAVEGGGCPSSKEHVLKVENVTMQFGGVIAVDNMNLEVNKGEIVSLIGPNGAGKTTAFNVITGVYAPTNGAVYYKDKKIIQNFPQGRMKKLYRGENADEYTGQHVLAPYA